MKLKTVEQNSIELGQPLTTNLYDRRGLLLLKAGHSIDTQSQLDALARRGLFGVQEGANSQGTIDLRKSVSPFEDVDNVYNRLESIMSNLDGTEDAPDKILNLSRIIQVACDASTDATLSNILLKKHQSYSLKHAIDSAIICEVMGRALQVPDNERLSLLSAALTQNIGMALLQDELHSQKESLTGEQHLTIRLHPSRGVEILKRLGVNDEIWLKCVMQHHETFDGKGYPDGIRDEELILHSRLLSLADYCSAKITSRQYRKPLSSHKAMQFIFHTHNSRFDPRMVEIFIKTLGIYLPGTIVRLRSGHIAVVTGRGKKIDFPIVYRIAGTDGIPLQNPLRRDTSDEGFSIIQVIAERDIKVSRYWLWRHGAFRE